MLKFHLKRLFSTFVNGIELNTLCIGELEPHTPSQELFDFDDLD